MSEAYPAKFIGWFNWEDVMGFKAFHFPLRSVAFVAILCILPNSALAQFWSGPVIDKVQLNVPFHAQDTLVWCWVASAKMAVEALGQKAPSQCDMLQKVYGAPCCTNPGLCARSGHISEIQNLISSFGFAASEIDTYGDGESFFEILRETEAPIIAWVDGNHFVVISGMRVVPSQIGPWGIVRIHDPIRGRFDQDWPVFSKRVGAIIKIEK